MADIKLGIFASFFDKASANIKKLSEKAKNLKKSFDKAGKSTKDLDKKAEKTKFSFKSLAKSFLTSKLSLAAFGAVAGLALKDFAKFQTKLTDVVNLFGGGRDEVKEFSKEILDLTTRVPQGAQDLAAALFDVVSAGIDAADSMAFLEVSASLATAGVTDTKTAVDGLTSVINAYSLEAEDAARISDIFFAAQVEGKTTIAELAGSIGRLAPIANATGIEIEEMFAAVATLTKAGIKTDEAVTSLRGTLNAILKPTEEASELADALGIDFSVAALKATGLQGVLAELQEKTGGNTKLIAALIPNVRALSGVLSLAGAQAETFAEAQEAVKDSTGATTKAVEKQIDTLGGQWKLLVARLNKSVKRFLGFIEPALTGTLRFFNDYGKNFKAVMAGASNSIKDFVLNFKIEMVNAVFFVKKGLAKIKGLFTKNKDQITALEQEKTDKLVSLMKERGRLRIEALGIENKEEERLAKEALAKKVNIIAKEREMAIKAREEKAAFAAIDEANSKVAFDKFLENLAKKESANKLSTDMEISMLRKILQSDKIIGKERIALSAKLNKALDLDAVKFFKSQKKTGEAISENWEASYDDQKSLGENFAKNMKDIFKAPIISYLSALQARVVAETTAGVSAAVAVKNYPQAALVAAKGAAAVTVIGASKSLVRGLETGGIVTGEGLYQMGEKDKKEAVIPLESVSGQRALQQASAINQNVNQNITLAIDGMVLAEIMTNKQAEAKVTGAF